MSSELLGSKTSMSSELLGSKTSREYQTYVNSLNFETFDIRKELDDKRNFAMTITSKRRTGKSVLLKHLCSQIKDWYQTVYVFSMSAHLQPDLFDFVPKDHIIEGFNEEKLKQIWTSQEQLVTKIKEVKGGGGDIPKVLIIFDDIIGDPKLRNSQTLNNYFILGRHLHFAQIILTQTMSGKWGVPGVIRQNVDVAVAFFLDSERCREQFCGQYLSAKNKKIGDLIFEKVTRDVPYQAIIVLNCVVERDPMKVIKTFVANPKIGKFKMTPKEKITHTSTFLREEFPSSGISFDFKPRVSTKQKTFKI